MKNLALFAKIMENVSIVTESLNANVQENSRETIVKKEMVRYILKQQLSHNEAFSGIDSVTWMKLYNSIHFPFSEGAVE